MSPHHDIVREKLSTVSNPLLTRSMAFHAFDSGRAYGRIKAPKIFRAFQQEEFNRKNEQEKHFARTVSYSDKKKIKTGRNTRRVVNSH